MKPTTYLSAAVLTIAGFSAAQAQTPKVEFPIPGKSVIIGAMSDNGKWGISETASTTDGDLRSTGGTLFNMETFEQTAVTHPSGFVGISDVTDDGNIVVGECNGGPGYWTKSTKTWTEIQIPETTIDGKKLDLGRFNAVTPDGKYAAGYFASTVDPYLAVAMVYDLTTGERVDLPGLPTLDQSHQDRHMNALRAISPDGRYIVGMLSQAFLMDGDYAPLCTYVYDIKEQTYDMVGFNDYADKNWVPVVPNVHFIDAPVLSNNGEWLTGNAYMVEEVPGSYWPNESAHPFRYNLNTKEFELFPTIADADIVGFSIGNDGTVYGATPATNPYPNCVVRSGDYFINLDQIFKQVYNYDFAGKTGYTVTGKPLHVSNDGKTIVMLPDTEGCYILRMPDPLSEAAAKVKLLGNYNVTPKEGVKLSRLTNITIAFDRNVKVRGNSSKVTFKSTDGTEEYTPVATNGVVADGSKVTVTFRSRDLSEGKTYMLTIPAGMIRMDGNEDEANDEITVTYNGRANTPVVATHITPKPDDYVSILDVTTNPIVMTFDADIMLAENGSAALYRNDETHPFCALNIGVNGNQAYIFPTSGQQLYLDTEYHVVIPEGTFTDISGGGANEEITFTYLGSYQRTIVADDKYIFSESCNNYQQLMFYEGDNLQPIEEVAAWGFTTDTTPWYIVRDAEDTNMAMASHSMYFPAGQADDWMVIPQLLIPNDNCYLEFLAQSYLNGYDDKLDIYILTSDNVYNSLNASIVKEILEKGELAFSEKLEPGKSEENLAGDWKQYRVLLDKYANKNIYIAFVNRNNDQSAIFVDDIRVVNDTPYITRFETPSLVVKQESVPVSGYMLFESDIHTYSNVSLELLDAEGVRIDAINEKGLNLSKGSQYVFKFSKELPLTLGETTTYYMTVKLDDEATSTITGKVANLIFQPERRIVLEEYTGSQCGNCPLGIRGMENIEMLYPGVMLPVAIRTYESDVLGLGLESYSQYLGLDQLGAPSAIIDRKEAGYGMIQHEGKFQFTGAGIPKDDGTGDERLWLDIFREEYEIPAELAVSFTSTLNEAEKKVDIDLTINNALNKHRAAYKVFAVVTEDGLTTYQKNYMSTYEDPALGEWGKGGKYGTPNVMPVTANHVARNTWGTTYSGTAGLFPSSMHAAWDYSTKFSIDLSNDKIKDYRNCEVIVMVLDDTNKVLNANVSPINGKSDMSGIETVAGEESSVAGMAVIDGTLLINAEGEFNVTACDLAGATLLSAVGEGYTALPLHGYKGVLIVKAADKAGNAKTAKFIVR